MVPDFAIKNAKGNQPRSRAYVGGYNLETGDIGLASSGGGAAPGGIGPTCSWCAEGNLVGALGGDPELVRLTHAYEVVMQEDGSFTVKVKPVCERCQSDFPNRSYFVEGITHEPGGDWDR